MTKNNKGRAGWYQATPKTSDIRNHTPERSIVTCKQGGSDD